MGNSIISFRAGKEYREHTISEHDGWPPEASLDCRKTPLDGDEETPMRTACGIMLLLVGFAFTQNLAWGQEPPGEAAEAVKETVPELIAPTTDTATADSALPGPEERILFYSALESRLRELYERSSKAPSPETQDAEAEIDMMANIARRLGDRAHELEVGIDAPARVQLIEKSPLPRVPDVGNRRNITALAALGTIAAVLLYGWRRVRRGDVRPAWRTVGRMAGWGAIALLLGASVAAVVWKSLPRPDYTARSFVRLRPAVPTLLGQPAGTAVSTEENFSNYQQTQALLAKSNSVISAVLAKKDVYDLRTVKDALPDPATWIDQALKIEFEGEVMKISLSGARAKDLRTIVDAVTEHYVDYVANMERMDRKTEFEKARRAYEAYMDRLREKRRSLRDVKTVDHDLLDDEGSRVALAAAMAEARVERIKAELLRDLSTKPAPGNPEANKEATREQDPNTTLGFRSIGIDPPTAATAQIRADQVKETYAKSEVLVPMRDGVKLFTAVYAPKDMSKTYPILLMRTPYSVAPYGPEAYRGVVGPSPLFTKSGYIVAYQDVRGRYMSEGEFVHMRPIVKHDGQPSTVDESTDAYDTIDWLVKNIPNNNGKVGIWGISYPGFYAACATIDAHPALAAASPQAPVTDWFVGDDWHHNGALLLPHAFLFMANFEQQPPNPTTETGPGFDPGTPDGYRFFLDMGPLRNANARHFHGKVPFWNDIIAHGTYDDFWKVRNVRQHLGNSRPAVMTVGGWFDAENHFGALETYKNIEASPDEGYNVLVMGPWRHGGWAGGDGAALGNLDFGSPTSSHYRETVEFPFFEHHLKGAIVDLPGEAVVFETGKNRWHTLDAWPPRNVEPRPIYLRDAGRLAFEPNPADSDEAFDEYTSDPARPVPYIDKIRIGMTGDYMTEDQRFAARRPDVLVYQSEPLEDDLTIGGPIDVEFVVSTTGRDSDWIVKLIDVYPDNYTGPAPTGAPPMQGFQMMVRGDVMRGKFRESLSEPRPFTPGQPTKLNFTLHDVLHTFRAGHRVMIQVQSSWFPLIDRNPQIFGDIYAVDVFDFHRATQRVYRSNSRPSRVVLPVVELPGD